MTVYCLEHTMNSPGIRRTTSDGPFKVVDLDAVRGQTAGYSGDHIQRSRTMHAIGWVLRHTYPYYDRGLTGYEDERLEWSSASLDSLPSGR